MLTNRTGRRLLKVLGVVLGVLVVLLTVFHFWFKAHALKMLEDLVETKSKGKLKLKLEKFSFNYFTKKMKLENAVFYTDSVNETTAYKFTIDKIELKAKAILPIVFRKEVLIDSIRLMHPEISVTRLKAGPKPDTTRKKDVSIPEEMGKIYSSIQDAMSLLRIKRFEINEGIFNLINRIDSTELPLRITHIQFYIDNFEVDEGSEGTEKILFSDNVVLSSRRQDIIFPDGRHRLSFSRFNINLKNQLVEFDSCTIAATRDDSASASFNVFFDTLQLTNIDFDTLYKAEVIKADSVYCVNPRFNLDVETGKKKAGGSGPPKLENIIEQLTGDLLLGYVVVKNASFNIKTLKGEVPTSFTFSNNNFEMQGLRVEQLSPKPVSVRSFSMAIRNYENFIKDSTYSVNFDSVIFKDDRITLNNFLFNKMVNGKVQSTFSIPQFNLTGLSWDDLVFENRLTALHAIMFDPYINFTASPNMRKRGGMNIFQSLGLLNEYMNLQQLDIIDGTIDLKLKKDLRVQLEDATLSVKSHSLLESKQLAGIKNSLLMLRFREGIIKAGKLNLEIYDIDYHGQSGKFHAGSIAVRNKGEKTILQNVDVGKMIVDEKTGDLYAEDVVWQKAEIRTDAFGGGKSEQVGSKITLRSVNGANTTIGGPVGSKTISANLNKVSFTTLEKLPGKQLVLEGLAVDGTEFSLRDKTMNLRMKSFNLRDQAASRFLQINYAGPNAKLSVPELTAIPQIKLLLSGVMALDAVIVLRPKIDVHVPAKNTQVTAEGSLLPKMNIGSVRINQPTFTYSAEKDSGRLSIEWQGKNASNFVEIQQLNSSGHSTQIGQLRFYLSDFNFSNASGRSFHTGNGNIAAGLRNIKLDKETGHPVEWQAHLSNLETKDLRFDSIGKTKADLVLSTGSIGNLDISSSLVLNLQKLIAANSVFRLSQLTGNYVDANNKWTWNNLGFNRQNNTVSLDSFSMKPLLTRDSFMARQTFQKDYMELASGNLKAGPIQMDKLISDDILKIGAIHVNNVYFSDYRDKRLPSELGVVKQLPVNLIKSIPQKIDIDSVFISNSAIEYSEMSAKTDHAADIPITRMQVKFYNLKNFDLKPDDSLSIVATGYLLDSAWMKVSIKESYLDSLAGFLMKLDLAPLDARMFNVILTPLENVEIESGFADSLTMRAIGREYLAIGEMKLFYHDLKVRFLPAEGKTGTIFTKLMNFIANTFVVKNKNTSKSHVVFFIRNRDRSAINYFVKIAMSGVTSSIGAKGNNKLIRKYKKELRKRNLPPVDFNERNKAF